MGAVRKELLGSEWQTANFCATAGVAAVAVAAVVSVLASELETQEKHGHSSGEAFVAPDSPSSTGSGAARQGTSLTWDVAGENAASNAAAATDVATGVLATEDIALNLAVSGATHPLPDAPRGTRDADPRNLMQSIVRAKHIA